MLLRFVVYYSSCNTVLFFLSKDEKYRVTAYDSIVTIVEPEVSIFDFKLCVTSFRRIA